MTTNAPTNAYREAGVDIDAGNRAVELMKGAVRSTFTPNVLADVGSFGGLFALADLPAQPVLVGSIDGVGTKVKLAAELGRWQGIGQDLVNHCVNDILVQNARPLFFLDYVASSKLDPQAVAEVVTGMAEACRSARCALIGGETAEMPGVYAEGAFDVAGAVVGLVDRASILPRQEEMAAGDILVGLPSSGPHTNGYSLIRRAVAGQDMRQVLADGQTLADALLAPHRCYIAEVEAIQAAGYAVKGMAHITGGGFVENVPRMLPPHLAARTVARSWTIPPVFQQLIRWSGISRAEAYRVFNLGIGMVLVLDASCAEPVLNLLPEAAVIGRLIARAEGEPPIQIIFPEKP
jgi:phosphoribosylformylglycinamidine cyclo-ligase